MGHHRPHHIQKPVETTTLLMDRSKADIFLVKTLDLDTLQQKELGTILAAHYVFLDKYMTAYINTQCDLFNALKDKPDSATAFRCADSLSKLKVVMEKELFLHFLSIKNICSSSQQAQYNKLIDNISQEFTRHHDFSKSAKPNHDTL